MRARKPQWHVALFFPLHFPFHLSLVCTSGVWHSGHGFLLHFFLPTLLLISSLSSMFCRNCLVLNATSRRGLERYIEHFPIHTVDEDQEGKRATKNIKDSGSAKLLSHYIPITDTSLGPHLQRPSQGVCVFCHAALPPKQESKLKQKAKRQARESENASVVSYYTLLNLLQKQKDSR